MCGPPFAWILNVPHSRYIKLKGPKRAFKISQQRTPLKKQFVRSYGNNRMRLQCDRTLAREKILPLNRSGSVKIFVFNIIVM